ncbi:hypothetical protein ScPMuIL_015658 [Solemya velum]
MPVRGRGQLLRKRQTIDYNLSLERPQTLQIFREATLDALSGIEARLRIIELKFYRPEVTLDDQIKRWLPSVHIVMGYANVFEFICKSQLSEIFDDLERSKVDPTFILEWDPKPTQQVMDCVEKILHQSREGFADVISTLNLITNYLKKYCLSFSGVDGDIFLETATNYEKQRQEFSLAVKTNLDNIKIMADRFEQTGIRITEFGLTVREQAERCGCSHIPILLIFPAALDNIRNAITAIRKWLEADEGYPTFVQCDIIELEKRKTVHAKDLRDLQVRSSNLEHRIKSLKRDATEFAAELKRLEKKEQSLKVEEDEIMEEVNDFLVDLDVKEMRRDEMKSKLHFLGQSEHEKYEKLVHEIVMLRDRKPHLVKKVDDLKKKIEFIRMKKDLRTKKEQQLEELKIDSRQAKKELRKTELDMERLDSSIKRLREIYRFKTSPEVLRKIFHKMPLTKRNAALLRKKKVVDKLEKATRVTAGSIEGDWVKLYRNLPFYPARGEENLKTDIDEIVDKYMRHTYEEQARQCLWRWRRVHTRACVDDLMKTLQVVKRRDIVEKIEGEFTRRPRQMGATRVPQHRTVRFPKVPIQAQ